MSRLHAHKRLIWIHNFQLLYLWGRKLATVVLLAFRSRRITEDRVVRVQPEECRPTQTKKKPQHPTVTVSLCY
jgi:hypothetical protein